MFESKQTTCLDTKHVSLEFLNFGQVNNVGCQCKMLKLLISKFSYQVQPPKIASYF